MIMKQGSLPVPMTDFHTHISLAAEALRTHRLRSFLTILGLTMGVATLMTVITLIVGANTYVQEKIANLGTDVFRIAKTPFATTNFEEARRARRNPDVLREDMAAVRESCPLCANVGAAVSSRIAVRYKNQEMRDVSIRGLTPNMMDIGTLTVERGRYFSEAENRHGAPVCLLGDDLTEQLFPAADPIGREVRVGKDPMLVIGTFERIGSVLGNAQDSFIVVPLDTFFRVRGAMLVLACGVRREWTGLWRPITDPAKGGALVRSLRSPNPAAQQTRIPTAAAAVGASNIRRSPPCLPNGSRSSSGGVPHDHQGQLRSHPWVYGSGALCRRSHAAALTDSRELG